MKPMMLAARPNFMQQEGAWHPAAAVQIVRDAAILAPRGADQRPQFRFKQRFLRLACLQQNDQRDRVFR